MKNNMVPNYLSSLIPSQIQNRYDFRNSENIPVVRTKTQLLYSSFLPATVRDWNTLPSETRTAQSVNTFKIKLQCQSNKIKKSLLNIGSMKNQILHCRLRLGCSALNYDLFRKKTLLTMCAAL